MSFLSHPFVGLADTVTATGKVAIELRKENGEVIRHTR